MGKKLEEKCLTNFMIYQDMMFLFLISDLESISYMKSINVLNLFGYLKNV